MSLYINFGKGFGLLALLGDVALLAYSSYYAKMNVKEPLQTAYVFNYAMTFIMCIMLIPVSIPGVVFKKGKFSKFDSEAKIGPAMRAAWYLSFGTFVITDPLFQIMRSNQGDDESAKNAFICMAACAGVFALAGTITIVGAVFNKKESSDGGGGGGGGGAPVVGGSSDG
ncbi:hypothetical protein LPJ57_001043 [Coemansia sp. RSA 486]|nr:hypothetical protein LPJ57_001043 [Coemansia sp. RSA 486]KAJ2636195.1 hypothetical protein GGF40_003155 [Coemansia sp. RSA 1286]